MKNGRGNPELRITRTAFSSVLLRAPSSLLLAVGALLLALCVSVEAQQAKKIFRIGYLAPVSLDNEFLQGLRDLGYIEGKNIAVEYRFADGKQERLAGLAAELIGLKVDVIVTVGLPAAVAAKQATLMIPIVMALISDPVGAGLVVSLARPGGNVTGLSTVSLDLTGKRLELLKETMPKVSPIAVLYDPRSS